MTREPISVLCVEDNELVGGAIGRKLERDPSFRWLGWVSTSAALYEAMDRSPAHVLCMDLDIPGEDTLEMIRQVKSRWPNSRVMILSGHVSADYIDRAVQAGASGYLSKAEDSRTIVNALQRVASGAFVLGPLTEGSRRSKLASDPANRSSPSHPEPSPPRKAEPASNSVWQTIHRIFHRGEQSSGQ